VGVERKRRAGQKKKGANAEIKGGTKRVVGKCKETKEATTKAISKH